MTNEVRESNCMQESADVVAFSLSTVISPITCFSHLKLVSAADTLRFYKSKNVLLKHFERLKLHLGLRFHRQYNTLFRRLVGIKARIPLLKNF